MGAVRTAGGAGVRRGEGAGDGVNGTAAGLGLVGRVRIRWRVQQFWEEVGQSAASGGRLRRRLSHCAKGMLWGVPHVPHVSWGVRRSECRRLLECIIMGDIVEHCNDPCSWHWIGGERVAEWLPVHGCRLWNCHSSACVCGQWAGRRIQVTGCHLTRFPSRMGMLLNS